MKRFKLLACLMSSIACLFGCGPKMPESDLVDLAYSRHTTAATAEFEGILQRDSAGGFILQATREPHGPLCEVKVDEAVARQFRQIIQEEKMYRYKNVYTPPFRVYDGWHWSFRAKFADGTIISSHGENAKPKGEGLQRLRSLMEKLIKQ